MTTKRLKKVKHHYLIGVGYNSNGVYVDEILYFTNKDVNSAQLFQFAKKPHPLGDMLFGFKLRLRYATLDLAHIKTNIPLSREEIVTYIKSLSKTKLGHLIKESETLKRI